VLAFVGLAALLPVAREAGISELRRTMLVSHGTAGSVVLLAAALALPVAHVRVRRHIQMNGVLSSRAVTAAVLLGQCLVLLMLASLMGLSSALLLHWGPGLAESGGQVTLHEGSTVALTRVDDTTASGRVTLQGSGATARRFEIVLDPEVRVRDEHTAALSVQVPITVALRDSAGELVHRQRLMVRPGRGARLSVHIAPDRGPLSLEVHTDAQGLSLEFPPESVRVLGAPAVLLAAVLRLFLWLGLLAQVPLALMYWFTGFVSAAIATAATLTVCVLAMFFGWTAGDPLTWVSSGMSPGWRELQGAEVPALLTALGVWVLPLKDQRLGVSAA
jgi:hypothetical protein